MRTTVTLDPDVQALLKKAMRERGISFKEALNNAVRSSLAAGKRAPRKPYKMKTYNMGLRPGFNLDKANQLAADLEDEEIIRKMELRK